MPRFLDHLMLVVALPLAHALAQPPRADTVAAIPAAPTPDFTWMNGAVRQHRALLESPYITGEFRADITWIADFNHPRDHTLVGSSESGRTSEIQVQQLGVGGDLHAGHARGRVMTQFGLYSTMTPRNDASPGRGQWDLAGAYRYLSEAYGGYHWDVLHGVNADAGIFMSYIGLFSYYNFDNWAYQPSYVSSNTPWFFNGLRVQVFPTERLKIEPWLVNGWQSYGSFNASPGAGLAVLWKATDRLAIHSNNYIGRDWLGLPDRRRLHTDNSVQLKYRERPGSWFRRGALSITGDLGCESGSGVSCSGRAGAARQAFAGFMLYDRAWIRDDRLAFTLGGGHVSNPGRYLVLVPPVNGATAFSGTPYFTTNPGDPFKAWDASATMDVMPDELTTFRVELVHRAASVPYFAGAAGVTPPGGNTGLPGSAVPGFTPDLRRRETRLMLALLVKL